MKFRIDGHVDLVDIRAITLRRLHQLYKALTELEINRLMKERMLIYLDIIMWVCVVVFAFAALIALLDLSGLRPIKDKGKSKVLFTALIVAVVGIGVKTFQKNINTNESSPPVKVDSQNANLTTKKAVKERTNNSIKIENNDLLAVKGPEGIAVISVQAVNDCKASYTWRFLPLNSAVEQSGKGELYEKYAVEKEDGKNRHLIDLNGRLGFKVGPFNLNWSCSDALSSHLYGDGSFELGKLSNTAIESFRF